MSRSASTKLFVTCSWRHRLPILCFCLHFRSCTVLPNVRSHCPKPPAQLLTCECETQPKPYKLPERPRRPPKRPSSCFSASLRVVYSIAFLRENKERCLPALPNYRTFEGGGPELHQTGSRRPPLKVRTSEGAGTFWTADVPTR